MNVDRSRNPNDSEPLIPEVIDRIPERATPMGQVARSSCFVTFAIVGFLLVLTRFVIPLPWTAMFCVTLFLFVAVFGLLLRNQPKR